jgi:hypothetical protein
LPYDGVYKIKADEPFSAHGYGFSAYDSYGYPLAGAMIDQTSNDNSAPEIKTVDLGNGNYEGQITELGYSDGKVSKTTDQLQTESISSGFTFIDIIKAYSYNYKFERDDFIPGETKVVNYKLTKILDYADSKAVIYVSDRRGNDTTIILQDLAEIKGQTPIITAENTNFGVFKNGQKKQLTFKLFNSGKVDSKPVEDIVLGNNNSGYQIISKFTFPLTLKANEETEIIVEFTAGKINGDISNNIGVKTVDTTIYRIMVTATVNNPIISVNDVNFGDYTIGKAIPKYDITITNSGKSILEIDKIDFPANNIFIIQVQQPSKENPLKIGTMASINLVARFDPKIEGDFKDSITFYTDGNIIKNVSYLSGKSVLSSVDEFESKFGVINIVIKENKISFNTSNELTLYSYNIFDINGKVIQIGNPNTLLNNYNIVFDNISGSVYFIELNTQYGKVLKKIIME